MKTRQRLTAILTAAFILSGSFPVSAAEADQLPEAAVTGQENTEVHGEDITEDVSSGKESEPFMEDEMTDEVSEELSLPETEMEPEDETEFPVPDEAPPFYARIEYRMGYTVIGTFTDFTPDIILIQTLYSLDGENWQTGIVDWNLYNLNTDDEDKLKELQNQPCLFSTYEPLKSYIAGEIDRFYLKLRITKRNGLSYETQSAAIERGGLLPIPEGAERIACFSSAIAVREPDPANPRRHRKYGRYQLTVSADATAEDISAFLPDTLPVEVQISNGSDFIAIGVVDCPVTWKPLSLPQLSAGESITVPDAAEEILVPEGTLVPTPVGTFPLDEPLSLNNPPSTDEVRLVLNVSPDDRNPTGVLKEDSDGLKIALHQKPTGATSIRAYVLTEGESKWTELSGLSLLKELSQPSTANSGYALVLRSDQEPYRSYLAATDAGETPTPFFIGLKIEGGVYDDRQLILAWPDTYEQLPDLPKIDGGAEGNEGNAGADNKEDSTESGQRPNLPQIPDDNQEEQPWDPAFDDNGQKQPAIPVPIQEDSGQKQPAATTHTPDPADTSAAGQEDGLKPAPLIVQAAEDIKDGESVPVFSDTKTTAEPSMENGSRIPLLLIITAVAAGGCIGAAACKTTGCRLFHRIAGTIRNILHR